MRSGEKEEFFKLLANEAGWLDKDTAKKVYYAILRILGRQLKNTHKSELPDLGEFYLNLYGTHYFKDLHTGEKQLAPPVLTMRFTPDYKLKEYFKKITKNPE